MFKIKMFFDKAPMTLEENIIIMNYGRNSVNLDNELSPIVESLFIEIESEFSKRHGSEYIVNDIEFSGDDVLLHLYHEDHQSLLTYDMDYLNYDIRKSFIQKVQNLIFKYNS